MGPAVSGGNMNSLRPNEGISLFERFSILLLIKIQIIKSNPKKEVVREMDQPLIGYG